MDGNVALLGPQHGGRNFLKGEISNFQLGADPFQEVCDVRQRRPLSRRHFSHPTIADIHTSSVVGSQSLNQDMNFTNFNSLNP
ncbi:MAG: hypothetical protein K6360_06315 [Deltaproteobacteria bacterium]